MGSDVFISYKSEEFDEANYMKMVFEKNGLSCWMAPMSITGGASYAVEIPGAIRNAKVFVLILSKKAQESKWVPREVDQAINLGKTILPFMIEDCGLNDDFNFYLTNVQRYEAYENKQAAINKILMDIRSIIGNSGKSLTEEENPAAKTGVDEDAFWERDFEKEKTDSVHSEIKVKASAKKKNWFLRLSPHNCKSAGDPAIKSALLMSDIYAGIALAFNLFLFISGGVFGIGNGWIPAITLAICSAFIIWYTSYATGLLRKKMPGFLAFSIQFITTVIVYIMITITCILLIV